MKPLTKTLVVGLSLAAALGLGTFFLTGAAHTPAPTPDSTLEPPPVPSVRTLQVTAGQLRESLRLTGDVVTETNVDIYPDAAGRLVSVAVEVGDRVVAGQTVLAEVDPSKPGAAYTLSPVYSPLTGTVTAWTAQRGATVGPQTSLGTVGILSDLLVESRVPEVQVGALRPGLTAEVRFEAFPGRVFPARVDRVSPVVDLASRTMKIRLRFTGEHRPVNLGMFAQVRLFSDPRPEAVLLPLEAVVDRGGQPGVFVVNEGTVALRTVTTGLAVDGTLEVTRGLRAGEVVVVQGQELLDDGAKVRVVK